MRKNKLWLDIKIAVKLEHTPLLALSTDKGLIPHEHWVPLDTSAAEANPSFPATPLHLLNALYISLRALALPNHSQQWLLSPFITHRISIHSSELRFQCLLFLNNQTKSISSIPSPGISNHLIITTADVREKCYLNKEVHSNIISKNKTWKPPKYSIIEEQL